MRPKGVWAGEEIPAAIAEGDVQRVRLCCIAVALENFPVAEVCSRAETALKYGRRPAPPVGRRCRQQRKVPLLYSPRDPVELVLRLSFMLVALRAVYLHLWLGYTTLLLRCQIPPSTPPLTHISYPDAVVPTNTCWALGPGMY